jgi:hypothetical protein
MIEEIDRHCIDNDRYGFTIPYLYKIEKDANRNKTIAEIIDFFTTAEKEYLISFCGDLDEYIIGLPKRESSPLNMYCYFGNLYYDQDSIGEFQSISDLIDFLIEEYQVRITDETYSKKIETGTWE